MKELSDIRVHRVNILLLNTFGSIICSNLFWNPSKSLQCSKGGRADTDLYPEEGRSSEAQVNALKMSKTHYYLIQGIKENAKEFGYS